MDNTNQSPLNRVKEIMLQIERIQLGRKQLVIAKVGDNLLSRVDAVMDNKADEIKTLLAESVKLAANDLASYARLYTTNIDTIHDLYKSVGEVAPYISGFRGYIDALNALLADQPTWRENLPVDNS